MKAEIEELRMQLKPWVPYHKEGENYDKDVKKYEGKVINIISKTWELRVWQTGQTLILAGDTDKPAVILLGLLNQETERLQQTLNQEREEFKLKFPFRRCAFDTESMKKIRKAKQQVKHHKRCFLIQTWISENGLKPDILLGLHRKPCK
jgi:hypothetical protein